MAIIKKYSPFQNLSNMQTFLLDSDPFSEYFKITEFKETLTGGKNGFLIEGSPHLKETTEVKIEVLDVNGDPIYYEPGDGIPEYYEGTSTLVSMHVYDDTPIGVGKITILGELKTYIDENGTIRDIPDQWNGIYNVKWEKSFKVNKLLANEDKVRFYRRPLVNVEEIVKSIFNVEVPVLTQTGSLKGIPQNPSAGTNLTNWIAGTNYQLQTTDSTTFNQSVDENVIWVPSLDYNATIRDVFNSKNILVDIPYTDTNNIVRAFDSADYTITYEDSANTTYANTSLTGSFAKIELTQLKTFVGDVARVKVFRKSRNEVADFQFVQESKLESSELLRDLTVTTKNEISYGFFTESTLENYWTTSSAAHPVSIDTTTLLNSVHIDYDTGTGGVQKLIANETVNISSDVEYTLSFKVVFNGQSNANSKLKVYLESLNNTLELVEVSADGNYQVATTITNNIISTITDTMNLVVEANGEDWFISNISLRNAEETSFSPDEFVLVQDIPRKLEAETFDFRFEFYDINNNYIPVDVRAYHTFTGGNLSNAGSNSRFMTFTASSNSFRFSTGSIGNPPEQQIFFTVTQNLLSGSTTYYSSAYDDTGTILTSASYVGGQYPGLFTDASDDGATLTISDFTGSRSDVTVGTIIYTASLDDKVAYATVSRFVDGANVSLLLTTANSNQFFYKLTDLTPEPSSQQIRFSATRYSLGIPIPPITVVSGSGKPPLTVDSDVDGTKTYSLNASAYPYSAGETTYVFSAVDTFAQTYTDEETVTPVIKQDGLSVTLSNEATSFPASSTGLVSSYTNGNGTVSVSVGSEDIVHSNGLLSNNTFDITSVVGSGCTPLSSNPTTNQYGISNMSSDSATLTITIQYKNGAGGVYTFTKVVKYSKARKGTPNIVVATFPASQSITATETGVQVGSFQNITVTAVEGTSDRFNYVTITGTTGFSVAPTSPPISIKTIDMSSAVMNTGSTTGTISMTVNYTNSEGTNGSKNITYSTSKVNKGDTGSPGSNGTDGADGADGLDGENPKFLDLVSPYTLIIYDENGENPTPSGSFFVTASIQNITDPLFKFYGDNVVSASVFTSSSSWEYTIPATTASFGDPNVINVEVSESGSQTGVLSDSVAIYRIQEGTTGPGIVFTGEYTGSRQYQYDISNGRRDAVLQDGVYYVANTGVPIATGSEYQPPNGTYWQTLGTEDFFVAAKIAIFDESFVKNTINVGTNNNGEISSANITLFGSGSYPYISLGQANDTVNQDFGLEGIWIGMKESSSLDYPMMSLVSDTGNYLEWNGTSLNISGSVYTQNGAIGGWEVNETYISSSIGAIILDGVTPLIGVGPNITISPGADLNIGFINGMSTGNPVTDTIPSDSYTPSPVPSGTNPTVIPAGTTFSKTLSETITAEALDSITISNISSLEVSFAWLCGLTGTGYDKVTEIQLGDVEMFITINGNEYTIFNFTGYDDGGRLQRGASQGPFYITLPELSGVRITLNESHSGSTISIGYRFTGGVTMTQQSGETFNFLDAFVSSVIYTEINTVDITQQTKIDDGGMIVAVSGNNYLMVSASSDPTSPYIQSVGKWIHNGLEIGGSGTGTTTGGTSTYIHPDHTGDVVSSGDGTTTYSGSLPVALGGTGNAYTAFTSSASTERIYTLPDEDATILTMTSSLLAGDILYSNGTTLVNLGVGNDGDLLTLNTGLPVWELNTGTKSNIWQLDSDNTGPKLKNFVGELQVRNSSDTLYEDLRADTIYANNDVQVNDSLTVNGTVTQLNTDNVYVSSSYIRVNSEYAGLSPTNDGDFRVGRGLLADARVLWDETDDIWKIGLIGSETEISLVGHQHTYTDVDFAGSGIVSGSIQIDHNTTSNYVSNQHIDHTTVSILGGSGLTGGGNISLTQTLNIGTANNGIAINADNIELDVLSSTFTTGVKNKLNTETVISGSEQIDILNTGTTYSVGDILYANTTTTLTKLNIGSDGSILSVSSGLPTWGAASSIYTDENAQDAIGIILTDSPEISFNYNDATPSISASLVDGSIDETKLDISVNSSLDLADSSIQPLDSPQLTSIELGHASDTTIARVSAGVIAVEGSTLATQSWVNTNYDTNVPTSLSLGTIGTTTIGITSDGGVNDVILPASTTTTAGLMTSTQFNKLSGIATNANNYSFPYTISSAASNNTVVLRSASGYIFANYLNTTANDVTTGVTKVMVETGNDNYIRHGSAQAIASFISGTTMNIAGSSTSCSGNAVTATSASTATTLSTSRTFSLTGEVTATGVSFNGSSNVTLNTTIAANVVGANELNVVGNGTTSQYLRSDGDGTFTWATPTSTGVTSVGATSPVASSGGTTPVISMTAAGSATSGYVTTGTQTFSGNKTFNDNVYINDELKIVGTGGSTGLGLWLSPNDVSLYGTDTLGNKLRTFFVGSNDNTYFQYKTGKQFVIRSSFGGTDVTKLTIADTFISTTVATTINGNLSISGSTSCTSTYTGTNFIIPSERIKKDNISYISDLDKFDQIKFRKFSMKDDEEKRTRYGVIVEEVEPTAPELVYNSENGKTVAYIDLLIAKMARMEQRIEELELKLQNNT